MKNHNFPFNSYSLLELKSLIETKLKFCILSKPDCAKLSQILLLEGYGSISETTLYRLFLNYKGIVPYRHTLNVLANYVGYTNWDIYYEAVNSNDQFLSKIVSRQSGNKELLYHCISMEADKPLFAYFESLADKDHKYQFHIGLDVFDSLQQVKDPKRFFKKFIKNDFVKEYVLENLFDPSFRIKGSDYAYELYPSNLKADYSLNDLRDFVFSKSVLFRYYYLKGDLEKALKIGDEMYLHQPFESNDLELLFIYPKMRYKAYKIWYLILTNKSKTEIEDYVVTLLEYGKTIYNTIEKQYNRIVFHCIAETFCDSTFDYKYFVLLKEIFKEEYELLPDKIFDKSIKNTLPYFEPNGLLYYRPLELSCTKLHFFKI